MLRKLLLILIFIGGIPSISFATPVNFVIMIADDISWDDWGCYGNSAARTPNIDALALEGVRFDQAYLTASSCSPSRASIMTGRYPHNNGPASELHRPIADHLSWLPEMLNETGYHTVLAGKNHMYKVGDEDKNTSTKVFDVTTLGRDKGNGGGHAHWVRLLQERPKEQPFFMWYAAFDAHRGWDADKEWHEELYGLKHKPESVMVPPFLVDDDVTRQDLAAYHNEVTRFDYFVGEVVKELKAQGVFENTVIVVMADNGRPFPRAKTRLHDSGMRTPFVVSGSGVKAGAVSSSLISAIDIAPTVLDFADLPPLKTHQGISLRRVFKKPNKVARAYAFSEHNWHDYEAHGRAVRHKEYLYILNSRPRMAWQGPADSVRSPSHQSLLTQRNARTLTEAQKDVFAAPRLNEELYYTPKDPHQLRNLAGDATHEKMLRHLRSVMHKWQAETGDTVPEQYSVDNYGRESGVALRKHRPDAFGDWAGKSVNARLLNKQGPH